jgi:hypothetical protein
VISRDLFTAQRIRKGTLEYFTKHERFREIMGDLQKAGTSMPTPEHQHIMGGSGRRFVLRSYCEQVLKACSHTLVEGR